ncbi:MAG: DNA-3-methyladenine glycosylase I, partial [Candidatus Methanomethylicus sp.]|nr:DNA-3-methyladenine glycosylase I [Candidatus Methanomethylicus sp.]
NWKIIDRKRYGFQKAFKNFSAIEVAKFTVKDIELLMKDQGIIRNRAKIVATVSNAKKFIDIRKEYGSFRSFLDALDKSDNYSSVIKMLLKKFKHIGPSTAEMFLWSIGETIKLSR